MIYESLSRAAIGGACISKCTLSRRSTTKVMAKYYTVCSALLLPMKLTIVNTTIWALCGKCHCLVTAPLAVFHICLDQQVVLRPGECSTLAADLQGAQSSGAELMQQREDLTAQAASLNAQLTDLQAAHETVRSVFCCFGLLHTMCRNLQSRLHMAEH